MARYSAINIYTIKHCVTSSEPVSTRRWMWGSAPSLSPLATSSHHPPAIDTSMSTGNYKLNINPKQTLANVNL